MPYTPSSEPNVWISASAVFSPMPVTPGMLSELSPIRLFTSIICAGATP